MALAADPGRTVRAVACVFMPEVLADCRKHRAWLADEWP
ncbi:hypothetical protein LHK_00724 [Laribacter hongkongensis HLHK9]|uniref:Uncharacterized protein n=1 Tax=Laribacter hongkongensis (strain HLHK9) TaxID=557598 RepID=C1D4C3_LARHH|nr:hypothetical protein LHK_00724 [Laribacter hongkongensis HLHK9]